MMFLPAAHGGPEGRAWFWEPEIAGGGALLDNRIHALTTSWYLAGLDSSNFWRIKQDNCAINIFDCLEDGFVIHTINDTCHLGPIGERFDSLDF